MLRYVLRRFLLLIPMVLAASVIIFLMLRLGTGDPALDYLRLSNLPPTPEMLASTRTMLGLDQPLYVQYGTWLWKALHLDFGISFASQRPVLDDMLNFLPATLELAGAALVLILLTSVPLGIWAARHRDRLPEHHDGGTAIRLPLHALARKALKAAACCRFPFLANAVYRHA